MSFHYITLVAPLHVVQVGSISWIMDELRRSIKPIVTTPQLRQDAAAVFQDKPMGLGDHLLR